MGCLRQMCWSWRLQPRQVKSWRCPLPGAHLPHTSCSGCSAKAVISHSSSPPGSPTAPVPSGYKRQHGPIIPAWLRWSRTISNPLLWGFTPMGAPGQPTSSSTSQPWSEENCFLLSLSPSVFNNAHLWTKPKSPQTWAFS